MDNNERNYEEYQGPSFSSILTRTCLVLAGIFFIYSMINKKSIPEEEIPDFEFYLPSQPAPKEKEVLTYRLFDNPMPLNEDENPVIIEKLELKNENGNFCDMVVHVDNGKYDTSLGDVTHLPYTDNAAGTVITTANGVKLVVNRWLQIFQLVKNSEYVVRNGTTYAVEVSPYYIEKGKTTRNVKLREVTIIKREP